MEQKKIDQALRLIESASKHALQQNETLEICYSGGKDSDVILHLARRAGVPFRAIYKNTTIDPPGTIAHCKQNAVEVVNPKIKFFELCEKRGLPNRFARFCCHFLKEYKIENHQLLGIRKFESVKRTKLYQEPQLCRFYSKKDYVCQTLPILFWTDEDLLDYITQEHVTLHPLYYREDGTIDVKRRLGCMCCPLQWQGKRVQSFKDNPVMVKLWCKAAAKFLQTHPNGKISGTFDGDPYAYFTAQVFFDKISDFQKTYGSCCFSGRTDFKQLLQDYFKIDL